MDKGRGVMENVSTEDEVGGVPAYLGPKVPGSNIDHIDVPAGIRMLSSLGWDPQADGRTFMVIEHALMRWARGEEAAAERGAIDASFYGIDLTSWRAVLAAAMAEGERKAGVVR